MNSESLRRGDHHPALGRTMAASARQFEALWRSPRHVFAGGRMGSGSGDGGQARARVRRLHDETVLQDEFHLALRQSLFNRITKICFKVLPLLVVEVLVELTQSAGMSQQVGASFGQRLIAEPCSFIAPEVDASSSRFLGCFFVFVLVIAIN